MCSYENEVFQFIYKIGVYTSIVPKWDFSMNKPDGHFPKYYRFVVLVIVLLGISSLIYESFNTLDKILHLNRIIAYSSTITFVSYVLLCSDIILNSSHPGWYSVLKRMSETPINKPNFKYNNAMFWKFVVSMILYLIVIIIDFMLYSYAIFYVLADVVLLLVLHLYSCIVFNMLMVLRDNFKNILHSLKKTERFFMKSEHIKMLQRRYLRNLDACETLNELSGKTFLLMIVSSSIQLLFCVNILIIFVQTSQEWFMTIFTLVYGLVTLHYTVVTILACHLVEKEAKSIVRQCYKHFECPLLMESRKNDLLAFALVAKNNLPKFTAWGFFNLTRGTILALLNTTSTYMIISYQFRNA